MMSSQLFRQTGKFLEVRMCAAADTFWDLLMAPPLADGVNERKNICGIKSTARAT